MLTLTMESSCAPMLMRLSAMQDVNVRCIRSSGDCGLAEFLLILLSVAGGVGAVPALVILLAGVVGLLLASFARAWPSLSAVDGDVRRAALWMHARECSWNALIVIGAAYGIGFAVRLVVVGS